MTKLLVGVAVFITLLIGLVMMVSVGILGGSANPRLFIPKMIEFWRQGRFPLENLVTTYKFAEFDKAWHDCEAAAVVKAVLVMESA